MKYTKLTALVLGLTLLSACGKRAETPAPTSSESGEATQAVESAPVSAAPEPSETPAVTERAEATGMPTPQPTEQLVQTHPIVTPAPTPEPTPEAPALTAADVYAQVSAAAGGSAMSEMSFALTEYYSLSQDDLEDYVLAMPDMSASIEEIFVAKVKSGRMDAVKSACEARQKGMAEDAEFYPDTGTYVGSYQLVTSGDWLLFCVCATPDAAVSAFNTCTK